MTSTPNIPTDLREMYEQAQRASEKAHSPYSQFKVGACIETLDGKLFSGCNVENASYGATVCAERVSIWKAVSELGASAAGLRRVLVYTATPEPWPPCGMCRQVISEFAQPQTEVICCNHLGQIKRFLFSGLLPEAFTPDQLKE